MVDYDALDEKPKSIKSRKRKSALWPLWILLKVLLALVILLAIGVIFLANVGGNSEMLKGMIEDQFSKVTGYEADIGTLNNVSFYPNINVDFEDLKLSQDQGDKPVATIGMLNVRIGFLDAVRGSLRPKNVEIRDLQAEKGVFTKDALVVKSLKIDDPDHGNEAPKLTLAGTIGNKPLSLSSTVAAYGTGEDRTYDLGQERQVDAQIGDLKISGYMRNPNLSDFEFTNLSITQAGQKIATGALTVKSKGDGRQVTGDISSGKGSQIKPDVFLGSKLVRGVIDAPQLHVEDIAPLMGGIQYLTQILPQKETAVKAGAVNFAGQDVDLRVRSPNIFSKGSKLAEQDVQITIKDSALRAESRSGKIFDGQTSWVATIAPAGNTHNLDLTLGIDNMPAENVLNAQSNAASRVSANVDGYALLTSSASVWEGFVPALRGDIMVVIDEGKIHSQTLNKWGNGLAAFLIPGASAEEELDITCGILDTAVANSIATFRSLGIDGKRAVVTGNGNYNINADRLNVKLYPRAKESVLGDISAVVNVTGPIGKPLIRADAANVTKQAADAILNNVNPDIISKVEANLGIDVFGLMGVERRRQPQQQADTTTQAQDAPAEQQPPVARAKEPMPTPCTALDGISGGNLAQKLFERTASAAQGATR